VTHSLEGCYPGVLTPIITLFKRPTQNSTQLYDTFKRFHLYY